MTWLVTLGRTALVLYFIHQLIVLTLVNQRLGLRMNDWPWYLGANLVLLIVLLGIGKLWLTVEGPDICQGLALAVSSDFTMKIAPSILSADFAALGRRHRAGGGRRRRPAPRRRHGRPLRAQPDDRPAGGRGHPEAHPAAARRPPDDRGARALGGDLRQGGRRSHHRPRRGLRAPAARPGPDPGGRGPAGGRPQPLHAPRACSSTCSTTSTWSWSCPSTRASAASSSSPRPMRRCGRLRALLARPGSRGLGGRRGKVEQCRCIWPQAGAQVLVAGSAIFGAADPGAGRPGLAEVRRKYRNRLDFSPSHHVSS